MGLFALIKSYFNQSSIKPISETSFNEGWNAYITANELFDLRKSEEALPYYDLAIKNGVVRAYNDRAFCLQMLGFEYDAIEDFDNAIRNYPVDANLYFGKACSLQVINRYEEASELFRKAIQLSEEDNELNRRRNERANTMGWKSANQLYRVELDSCLSMISFLNDVPAAKEKWKSDMIIKRRNKI